MKNHILIIDNDTAVRDSLKRILQENNYAAVLAADGQRGVECLSQQAFDLLILDLDLPELNGFDVIDLAIQRFPSLPILVLTGILDQCEPGSLTHIDVVMEKPADVPCLLQTVRTLTTEPELVRMRRLSLSLMPSSLRSSFPSPPGLPTKPFWATQSEAAINKQE